MRSGGLLGFHCCGTELLDDLERNAVTHLLESPADEQERRADTAC